MKIIFQQYLKAWMVPLFLLMTCIFAFGLLIPWLGYYWDDWETILVLNQFPISEFWHYFPGDRPFAAWTYVLFSPILGIRPINWHIFTLFLRWVTVLSMWWSFTLVWKTQKVKVTQAALLFAVYPIFFQQSISVAYHQHWTAYALYFISIGTMVVSINRKGPNHYLYLGISLGSLILNLAIFEYFVGVELLRPLILWIFLGTQPNLRREEKWRIVLKCWIPYMLLLLAFVSWRVLFAIQHPIAANSPGMLFQLIDSPIKTLVELGQLTIVGLWRILIRCWIDVFAPRLIYPTGRFVVAAWVIGTIATLTFGLILKNQQSISLKRVLGRRWEIEAMIFGSIATILGSLPAWITGRQVLGGFFGDRFALVSMFGASFFWIALLNIIPWKKHFTTWTISILLGLAVVLHLRIANDYRRSWLEQVQFNWQLYWRAPAIEPPIALIAPEDLFGFTRPTFSTNVLYLEPKGTTDLSYWFYLLPRLESEIDITNKEAILLDKTRQFTFMSRLKDSLILYEPSSSDCLWVLNPSASNEPGLGKGIKTVALLSTQQRILNRATSDAYPLEAIFGREPPHGWCFYYEKAELARQFSDWEKIVEIGETAISAGYLVSEGSSSVHELLPFIEGYAMSNRWDRVAQLVEISLTDNKYQDYICSFIGEIFDQVGDRDARDQAKGLLHETMSCENDT